MVDKEDTVYIARLAEQAERYEEMVEQMKTIAKMGTGLSAEERNLLSVAYKNVIGSRRAAWRIISSLEEKSKEGDDHVKTGAARDYKREVEKELQGICQDILDLLDRDLIPYCKVNDNSKDQEVNSKECEAVVFYHKMKGDYQRYLAEFTTGNDRKEAAEQSLVAYKKASEVANPAGCGASTDDSGQGLIATHPIRLGLALNFSVFYYEILNSPERACALAKAAFDEAIQGLDNIDEDKYKDSTLIMQLLRDNLTLWTSDCPDNEEDGKDKEQVEDVEES